jgi:hypothetical protein
VGHRRGIQGGEGCQEQATGGLMRSGVVIFQGSLPSAGLSSLLR